MTAAPVKTTPQPMGVRLARRRGAIFAVCKALGLDNDARRAVIKQLTGCDSLTKCNLVQLGTVLDHLNRGTDPKAGRRRITPAPDRAPLLGKIDALLAELHRVTGEPKSIKYADAIAKRNGWAENVDFADPAALRNVVAALNRTLQSKIAGS